MTRGPRVEAVIPARNEERYLPQTLDALFGQTSPLDRVILVNDNSIDATARIGSDYGCDVVNITDGRGPRRHGSPSIAEVFNAGLAEVSLESDYVMILGADHTLSRDYVGQVINHMERDGVSLGSGLIDGEATETPRGSGRLVSTCVWLKVMGRLAYPLVYGFETYLPLKMQIEGYRIAVYRDVSSHVQRATGLGTNYVAYGRGMKFLGYTMKYAFVRCAFAAVRFRDPGKLIQGITGYLTYPLRSDVGPYLSQVQDRLFMSYVHEPGKLLRKLLADVFHRPENTERNEEMQNTNASELLR